jgi:transposase
MGFLGLVPSEYSSGVTRRQGAITKTGNSHARRVLLEAAWNYRFPARVNRASQVRHEGLPPAVREIACRAQLRLTQRYRHLAARQLALNKICSSRVACPLRFRFINFQHWDHKQSLERPLPS